MVTVALTPTGDCWCALRRMVLASAACWDFAGAFGSAGSGSVRFVRADGKQAELAGLTLYLFNANPALSTFTDNVAAAIAAGDVAKVLMAISLDPDSQLGTHTIYSATVDATLSIGATDLYGVLIIDGLLTDEFTTTGDVMVELTVTQDI